MSLITVGLGQTETIRQSGTDSVSFVGAGTLAIAGTAASPIDVVLSQVAGVGALDTITLSNANVTLGGVAGVSALVTYAIGSGGRLTFASTAGVALGSQVVFTAPGGTLAFGSGTDAGVLSSISGFTAGSTIDVSALASSVSYADNAGSGTGGTLTLLGSGGQTVARLALSTGEYVAGDFQLSSDGTGGTLVGIGVAATGMTAAASAPILGVGGTVKLSVTTSAPVTVAGGTPTLALNDGGVATYNPAESSATKLVFDYTVAAGQNTRSLAAAGVSLNGASLTGAGGVPVSLSAVVGAPAGTLQVDTTAPIVTGVTTTPGTGTLTLGQPVMVGLTISEGVTVSGGTPTLALNDGGSLTYDPAASTPTMLAFTGTVGAGQSTPGLAVTGVTLNGASITDGAGNVADLSRATISPTSTVAVNAAAQSAGPVYRFFDSGTGTHFFTSDVNEKNTLMDPNSQGYRPDLKEETNNFGAVSSTGSTSNTTPVYRFFDTVHGTHFFTASQAEATGLRTQGSSTYRADLVYEPSSGFTEHATAQAGDVAVYRFFDTTYGTHFYTGSQSEAAAISTPGGAGYRADLVAEGIGFYAPAGSYS